MGRKKNEVKASKIENITGSTGKSTTKKPAKKQTKKTASKKNKTTKIIFNNTEVDTKESLIIDGYVFLKEKGDKLVFSKNGQRKIVDK